MKEGQIVNKLVEEYDKKHRKELTDKQEVLGEYSEAMAVTDLSLGQREALLCRAWMMYPCTFQNAVLLCLGMKL